MRKIQIAVTAAALVIAAQARASLTTFDISFEYNSALVGSGSVQAADQGGGVYVAQSGSFTVKPGQFVPAGMYDFVSTPPPFSERFQNDGGVLGPMDDQILVSAGVPALSYDGLLFTQPFSSDPAPAGTAGINLWENVMSFDAPAPSGQGNNYGTMTVTFAPVPEPATLISGALLLLPFGASTLRILRRRQAA
jgi:hypothetical protein